MANGILIALSNPVSKAREAEFNQWYNEVHGPEVISLDGFASMTRYSAVAQAVPPADEPAFRYLTVYELDDVDGALAALARGPEIFSMSDSVDLPNALGIGFVKIFSTRD